MEIPYNRKGSNYNSDQYSINGNSQSLIIGYFRFIGQIPESIREIRQAFDLMYEGIRNMSSGLGAFIFYTLQLSFQLLLIIIPSVLIIYTLYQILSNY